MGFYADFHIHVPQKNICPLMSIKHNLLTGGRTNMTSSLLPHLVAYCVIYLQ